jgi:hypothetical protein
MNVANVLPHDATSRISKVVATVGDGGEIGITGDLYLTDTAGQLATIADVKAGTEREAIITGPPDTPFTWTMRAVITNFTPEFNKEGVLGYSATLKVSGEPVFAYTHSANLTSLVGIEEENSSALTFTPTFAGAVYEYNVTINAASKWIKLTPTLLGATITISNGTTSQDVLSGAQSGTIAVTDGAITTVTLAVKEAGKVAKKYTLHVYTP